MTGLKTNERLLYEILNDAWPGEWESDTVFLTGRKYRGDAVNKKRKIIIEINGGIWMPKGGHNTGFALERDYEKFNLAVLDNWKPLLYSPETLRKRPYKIIRDIRMLCGASLNDTEQTLLCLDAVKQPGISMQVKIS